MSRRSRPIGQVSAATLAFSALADKASAATDGSGGVGGETGAGEVLTVAHALQQVLRRRVAPGLVAAAVGAVALLPLRTAGGQTPLVLERFPVETPCTLLGNYGDDRPTHKHVGEDISAVQGHDVVAALRGKVTQVWTATPGLTTGAGNGLEIRRDDGTYLRYFHLKDITPGIVKDSVIASGQLLGHVGDTGATPGAYHLHFEVHPAQGPYVYEDTIDPVPLLVALGGCDGSGGGGTPPPPTPPPPGPPPPETPIFVPDDRGGFIAMTPERRLDTRVSEAGGAAQDRVASGGMVEVALAGVVPDSATAVALNVTAADPAGAGYLTAYPCGPRPSTSTLNYRGGETVPGAVIVGLSADRSVCITTYSSSDVLVDLAGWFEPASGSRLTPLTPTRVLDTRTDEAGRLIGGDVLAIDVTSAGIPAEATGVALNVTATQPAGPGYVTAWPCDQLQPIASNLNPAGGATVANLVNVAVGSAGRVCFSSYDDVHLVVDALGWFGPGGAELTPVAPTRVVDTRDGLAGDRLAAGETLTVNVRSQAGLPSNVSAVQATLTVTNPSSSGYLTAWPCGERPLASNVNYVGGATVANSAQVTLSAAGELCVFSLKASEVLVDVTGVWRHAA